MHRGAAESRYDLLRDLLDAVLTVGAELDLDRVLPTVVDTARQLVGARYAALGVVDEAGRFTEMICRGYCAGRIAADGGELPHGVGLLGDLVRNPRPLRVDDVPAHPAAVGYPADHPVMGTLLGVPIEIRHTVYGNLYLADKLDGGPFTDEDQEVVTALARAAGVAIENARLYRRLCRATEDFQRRLLPEMPRVEGWELAARYRPSTRLPNIGGDWYDVIRLPDRVPCLVVGDAMGHDVRAASVMTQVSNMLRVVAYYRRTPPSTILHGLDQALHDLHGGPMSTALVARVEPVPAGGRRLHWCSAGHPPPLLAVPGERARYLGTDPGPPLGIDVRLPRADHRADLPADATLLLYTDGLIEHRDLSVDEGMARVADIVTAHAAAPLGTLCDVLLAEVGRTFAETFEDDVTVLAVRPPS